MDRSWMRLPRHSVQYYDGVMTFLRFILDNCPSENELYRCPCIDCVNAKMKPMSGIRLHLIQRGMLQTYTVWNFHGEELRFPPYVGHGESSTNHSREWDGDSVDQTLEYIEHVLPVRAHDVNVDDPVARAAKEIYDRMIKQLARPLYKGSKVSSLRALLQLMAMKSNLGMSNKTFDAMCELHKGLFPTPNDYPESYADAKKKFVAFGTEVKILKVVLGAKRGTCIRGVSTLPMREPRAKRKAAGSLRDKSPTKDLTVQQRLDKLEQMLQMVMETINSNPAFNQPSTSQPVEEEDEEDEEDEEGDEEQYDVGEESE